MISGLKRSFKPEDGNNNNQRKSSVCGPQTEIRRGRGGRRDDNTKETWLISQT
jgi:hypothetical protein